MRTIVPPISSWERLELPDGDFVDLAWATEGLSSEAPLVICLHGLGGSVDSSYAAGFLKVFNDLGWRAVLMHFRGAGREPNRKHRAYHSGDTEDLNYLLNILNEREPDTLKAAVGVSLGGNVLLKWLGEQGEQSLIQSAVAISVPFELRLAANKMTQGFARFYQSYLLDRMREAYVLKRAVQSSRLPEAYNEIDKCQCFWTFDEKVTAPLNGFSNVHAYYRTASSRQYLKKIKTPTHIIHALDDPFMTPEAIPTEAELSPFVTLELTEKGGHVGFIADNLPTGPLYWLDVRVPEVLRPYFEDEPEMALDELKTGS